MASYVRDCVDRDYRQFGDVAQPLKTRGRYVIRLRTGFYYQRGPVPHWVQELEQATVFEFQLIAEFCAVDLGLPLDAYDVVPC